MLNCELLAQVNKTKSCFSPPQYPSVFTSSKGSLTPERLLLRLVAQSLLREIYSPRIPDRKDSPPCYDRRRSCRGRTIGRSLNVCRLGRGESRGVLPYQRVTPTLYILPSALLPMLNTEKYFFDSGNCCNFHNYPRLQISWSVPIVNPGEESTILRYHSAPLKY